MHIAAQTGAMPKSRNSLGRLALCAIALAALVVPQLTVAADRFEPAAPEPGTEIPKATIKFGMRPYADNTFYYIGIKKGWFDEVGISFDPPPYGIKANDSNVLTLMLNGQLDVISEYCPLILPTYKDSRALKCIGLVANNIAFSILANPALKLKPIKEYIGEGMNFDEALKATLAPVDGKTLVVAPELSARPFQEGLSNLSGVKWNLQVLEDSKMLVLAKAGRVDFVNPEGAPITYTLRQAGWTDLVDIGDLVKYGPRGEGSPLQGIMNIIGVAGNADYVNKNQNTVLRFMSVVWRIIDETKKDPSLFDIQAPFLNSFAGTDLDGKGVADTVNTLDPLTPFEENRAYYDEPDNLLYIYGVWNALIAGLEEHRIIPKGIVTPKDVIWGGDIWHQMVDYKEKSDNLFAKLGSATLTDDQKALFEEAKAFYAKYDFLDSYRLALAAAS